ncbi:MAG TPA: GNAT family N-acyltransferase [Oligoflexia bacterium]|nr:GNAT family N-acyltransferase [Oligoflexia bacterium]HMR25272.1 GNAT family N-acyltransferase [Oligoflexia bacterium]
MSMVNDFYIMLAQLVKKILAYDQIEAAYLKYEHALSAKELLEKVLSDWQISVREHKSTKTTYDRLNKVLIVANHPFGGVEGMILTRQFLEQNAAIKVLVNPILKVFKPLRENFLFVEPYEDIESKKLNVQATKQAIQWLKQGNVLAMFPAGEVSSYQLNKNCVVDPVWSKSCAAFVEKAQCSVLPVFFHGQNSKWFQALGVLHPKIRTLLLGRELVNKQKQTIHMTYGNLVQFNRLPKHLSREELSDYFRFLTYSIAKQGKKIELYKEEHEEIEQSYDTSVLQSDIDRLPESALLLKSKNFSVYVAEYEQIPKIMHEIAKQRERSFRKVGEGTGKAIDTDSFDPYYKHLFVWDDDAKKIVGAYRIALSDEVKQKKQNFYSQTLFGFDQRFINEIEPAIEMGRSFVSLEYQKSFTPLLLLWKGIGQFVARYPKYTKLFGPVSISGEFSPLSKTVIKQYLLRHYGEESLKKHVQVKVPFNDEILYDYSSQDMLKFFNSLTDISNYIDYQEKEFAGIPVLIKHYIKLGAKFIDFNVDPEFNNALDALILVDLKQTEEKSLKNYMGEDGYQIFRSYHNLKQD